MEQWILIFNPKTGNLIKASEDSFKKGDLSYYI